MSQGAIKIQKYLLKQQLKAAQEQAQKALDTYKQVVERYNQLLKSARELNQSCNMQALLLASLIKESPDQKIELQHATMNSFEKTRIQIDAKADDERAVQILTFVATPIPQEELDRMDVMRKQMEEIQRQQAAAQAPPVPPCTDPECKLPKDLVHTHNIQPVAGETVPVPDAPNADEPQSGKVLLAFKDHKSQKGVTLSVIDGPGEVEIHGPGNVITQDNRESCSGMGQTFSLPLVIQQCCGNAMTVNVNTPRPYHECATCGQKKDVEPLLPRNTESAE